MRVENAVYPTGEQLSAIAAGAGDGPIVMVNLLKFKAKAVYPDGRPDDVDGRTAYARYAAEMAPYVESRGGRMVFLGDVGALVIGQVEEPWDAVAVVEYPSLEAFVAIATSPDVAAFGVHREAGLAGQLLIQTTARAGL